jgi:hypothetical protein
VNVITFKAEGPFRERNHLQGGGISVNAITVVSTPFLRPYWEGSGTWTEYRAIVPGGACAGHMVVTLLEPGLGFVGYVRVGLDFQRQGVALALHDRAAADHGTIAIEHYASAAELALWSSLARRGWTLGEQPSAGRAIGRGSAFRMLTATPPTVAARGAA